MKLPANGSNIESLKRTKLRLEVDELRKVRARETWRVLGSFAGPVIVVVGLLWNKSWEEVSRAQSIRERRIAVGSVLARKGLAVGSAIGGSVDLTDNVTQLANDCRAGQAAVDTIFRTYFVPNDAHDSLNDALAYVSGITQQKRAESVGSVLFKLRSNIATIRSLAKRAGELADARIADQWSPLVNPRIRKAEVLRAKNAIEKMNTSLQKVQVSINSPEVLRVEGLDKELEELTNKPPEDVDRLLDSDEQSEWSSIIRNYREALLASLLHQEFQPLSTIDRRVLSFKALMKTGRLESH